MQLSSVECSVCQKSAALISVAQGEGEGDGSWWRLVTQQADTPNDIGRNFVLGNRKKIAKFLMRTFTCRSTFLYGEGAKGGAFLWLTYCAVPGCWFYDVQIIVTLQIILWPLKWAFVKTEAPWLGLEIKKRLKYSLCHGQSLEEDPQSIYIWFCLCISWRKLWG